MKSVNRFPYGKAHAKNRAAEKRDNERNEKMRYAYADEPRNGFGNRDISVEDGALVVGHLSDKAASLPELLKELHTRSASSKRMMHASGARSGKTGGTARGVSK